MARQLLSKEHVHRTLKRLKCRYLKDYETASGWETASGIGFTVPFQTPEQRTDADTLQEIVLDVQKWNLFTGTKPPK